MLAHSAWVLVVGTLFMLLSVRLATSVIERPTLVRAPLHTGRLVSPEPSELLADLGLQTSLPTRGPPGRRSPASLFHGSSPPVS